MRDAETRKEPRLGWGAFAQKVMLKKPLQVIWAEESDGSGAATRPRVLSLFDLVCIGVGGTVGSGVFVLTGTIAAQQAGPAVVLCWLFSCIACVLSGLSYMEMCGRVPSGGSCYAYSYVALGELPAVIAASFLTLEYGISCSAVARSWGDKFVYATGQAWVIQGNVSLMAGVVTAASTGLLLCGLSLGKNAISAMTCIKVLLVIFMIVMGFINFQSAYFLDPFIPPARIDDDGNPAFGWGGVLRGTTMAFFGFIGFDEVCCMSAESRNPAKVMPRAVILTISITAVLSILAAVALCGMVPMDDMGNDFGFASALKLNNMNWAARVVEIGELTTLSVVVLVSFLAQPHLQLAMARDGLLPRIFAVEKDGVLRWNLLATGGVLTAVSVLVPFEHLNEMIDAGVLLSLIMTNLCVILLRRRVPGRGNPKRSPVALLTAFVALAFVTGFAAAKLPSDYYQIEVTVAFGLAALAVLVLLAVRCPETTYADNNLSGESEIFRVPGEPFIPGLGIALNFYLVAQLSAQGLALIVLYVAIATVLYLAYGYKHSVGQNTGWGVAAQENQVKSDGQVGEEPHVHLLSASLQHSVELDHICT